MTDFNYKKYSLENLEKWLNDALSSAEATPQEIYDVIVGVVRESYDYHKEQSSQAEELLNLLNSGWTKEDVLKERDYYEPNTFKYCNTDDTSPECMSSWSDFWSDDKINKVDNFTITYNTEDGDLFTPNEDKVNKWRLLVEIDDVSGDYYFTLPEDLLERTGWKENDDLYWVDNGDGSFTLTMLPDEDYRTLLSPQTDIK